MVYEELIEIEGKWKSLGSTEKAMFSHEGNGSGKEERGTCWLNGSAILTHCAVSGVEWHLKNRSRTTVVRIKTSTDVSQIKLVMSDSRFQVKQRRQGFVIIPHHKNGIEQLFDGVKNSLLTLKRRRSESGDEMLSAEAALDSLFNDLDDDITDTHETKTTTRDRLSTTFDSIRKDQTPPSARRPLCSSFYRSSSTPRGPKIGLAALKRVPIAKTSLSEFTGKTTSLSDTKKQTNRLLNLVPQSSSTKESIASEAPVLINDSDDETILTHTNLGFRNLGNTCYMNVVWQSLLSLDTFAAELLHSFNRYQSSLEELSLLRCLSQLALYKKEKRTSVTEQEELLRKCIKAVATVAARYDDHRQHDAHEFFSDVIDMIKEEIIKLEKNCKPTTQPTVNAVVDNFAFELQARMECSACGHTTTKSETQHGLTVTIPEVYLIETAIGNKRKANVQDAVDTYFKPEVLDYLCDMCGGHSFRSYHSFKTVPRVLVVVVKRYDSKGLNKKMVRRLGINKHVTLASHCFPHVPTASAPTIPVELSSSNIEASKTPSHKTLNSSTSQNTSENWLKAGISSDPKAAAPSGASLFPKPKKKLLMSPPPFRSSEHKAVSSVKEKSRLSNSSLMSPPRQQPKSLVRLANLSSNGHSVYEKDSESRSKSKADRFMDDADDFFINDDDDFEAAVELSKQEAVKERKHKLNSEMSEKEQIQLAMARSLAENQSQMHKLDSPRKVSRPLVSINSNKQDWTGLRGGSILGSDTEPPPPKLRHSCIVGDVDVSDCSSADNPTTPLAASAAENVYDVLLSPDHPANDKDKENIQPVGEDNLHTSTPSGDISEQVPLSSQALVRTEQVYRELQLHEKNGTELGYSYKLVGVVSHIGSSSACGHYVNDVYNIKDDVWLSYDDHRVDQADIDIVRSRREENSYIFFYMDLMVLNDLK